MTCSNLSRDPADRRVFASLERSTLKLSPSRRTRTVEHSSKHHKITTVTPVSYVDDEGEAIVLVAPLGYRNDINANARVVRVVPRRTGGYSPGHPKSTLPVTLSPSRFQFRPIREDGANDTTKEIKTPSNLPSLPLPLVAATKCPPKGIRLQPRFSSANVLVFRDSCIQIGQSTQVPRTFEEMRLQ
jgi:hypothetical protein